MRDAIVTDPSKPASPASDAGHRAPYVFAAAIAKGGMGYVELCYRVEGNAIRWAARKRLHPQLRGDRAFRAMFMDEARLAGLIRHPNVVGVSEVGEDADGPYLIMDYVEGLSLSRLARHAARAGRPVPMQVAVRICQQVAVGLHAAHEVRAEDGSPLNLVHRDVSPQNVLIGFDGSVRVTDFGIAKALGNASQTTSGVLKGNMAYLSPEQLRFQEPDRRSDLFSLGVTLYELLSGARLYANRAGFDGTRRILSEPPPDIRALRGDVPAPLAELTLEMLAKETTGRPATALEVASRLDAVLAGLVASEGAIRVGDYMDAHFATTRERHRARLAERLRGGLAPESADSRPAPPDPPRRRRGWVPFAAAGLAAALAAFAGVRLTRHPPPEAAPISTAALVPAAARVEIVSLPPPLPAPAPEPPPAAAAPPTPRPPAARPAAHHRPRHRLRPGSARR
jgi:serine/threonine protein kinase